MGNKEHVYFVEAYRETGPIENRGGIDGWETDNVEDALDIASNLSTWSDGVDMVYVTEERDDDREPLALTFYSQEDAEAEYMRAIGRA